MNATFAPDQDLEITTREIFLLRYACDLVVDDESPYGGLAVDPQPNDLENAARTLVEKGLATKGTFRPDRELIRRLLVTSQPDCRIVLLLSGPGRGERLIDLYERAGAFVSYRRSGDVHRLGPPLEYVDVVDEVLSHFRARRSTGDFIDFRLTPAEYFLFCIASREVARQRVRKEGRKPWDGKHPGRWSTDSTLDGEVKIAPQSRRLGGEASSTTLSVPEEGEWHVARDHLIAKDILEPFEDGFAMRPYLEDLGVAIANRNRHILTRFDFGAVDWFIRDLTVVTVPGSVFTLRTTREGHLEIKELDEQGIRAGVKSTIEDLHGERTLDT